jgi:hypothetical protein
MLNMPNVRAGPHARLANCGDPANAKFVRLVFLMMGLCLGEVAWGQSVLMVVNPAYVPDSTLDLALSAGAFAGDDVVPVNKVGSSLWPADYHTRSGTNLGVANGLVDLGASDQNWNFGAFYRQDWLATANRDTVAAYALYQRNQLVGQDRNYNLNYSLNGLSADGLRMGYANLLPWASAGHVVWGVSASLLQGLSVRQDEAQGELTSGATSGSVSGNRQLINSQLNAVSSGSSFNDFIPPEAMNVPHGLGYGLDLGLTWIADNGAKVSLAANDLAGRIHWDRVPLIQQNITNLSVPTPNPGSEPAVSGRNVYESFTQKLQPKYMLEGEYPFGRVTAMAQLEEEDGYWFPQLGLGYALTGAWKLGVDYETRFGSFGVNVRNHNFYFGISTQSLNVETSRALGVSMGAQFSF